MAAFLQKIALLALITGSATVQAATGKTTRYWDCCKGSCGWTGKASVSQLINSCDANDSILASFDEQSACNGGDAHMCTNQSPWAVSDDLALGFAAVKLAGGSESSWCCSCYKLTFTSGAVAGKSMIVQATNTGGDLGDNHFDLAMPGGGVGIYNACTAQWGAPANGWGQQYGGISSRSECDSFPDKLKDGCYWRFDWFQNADNPSVEFEQVTCPKELTDRTGCIRTGETPTAVAAAAVGAATSNAQSSTVAASSSATSPVASAVDAASSATGSTTSSSTGQASSPANPPAAGSGETSSSSSAATPSSTASGSQAVGTSTAPAANGDPSAGKPPKSGKVCKNKKAKRAQKPQKEL